MSVCYPQRRNWPGPSLKGDRRTFRARCTWTTRVTSDNGGGNQTISTTSPNGLPLSELDYGKRGLSRSQIMQACHHRASGSSTCAQCGPAPWYRSTGKLNRLLTPGSSPWSEHPQNFGVVAGRLSARVWRNTTRLHGKFGSNTNSSRWRCLHATVLNEVAREHQHRVQRGDMLDQFDQAHRSCRRNLKACPAICADALWSRRIRS